ncbi:hypothetical protein CMV60_10470 [Serratia marcescens]|nr:hypothetical protein CMV60_10470 [Serratia marcescens]
MENKLSELRHLTPRQIAVYRDRVAISDSDYELIPVHTGDLRALLAELEAKDKRIAELERANQSQDDHINQQQDRIESLEKKNGDLGRALGAAEKRLATPIKIVNYDEFFICHVSGASDDYCKGWVDGRNAAARDVGKAGFTVEGDDA